MRTTISIDDHLLAEAKRAAITRGTTLGAVVEDALRVSLASGSERQDEPFHLTTVGGAGLRPGVDINDSAGLLELMEEDEEGR